ncbi:MAG TPA: UvrD-helicase domain-containing protein [Rhodanobacteraceae bacterium]
MDAAVPVGFQTGRFWTLITLRADGHYYRLGGLPNKLAKNLQVEIKASRCVHEVSAELVPIRRWLQRVDATIETLVELNEWLPTSRLVSLTNDRPALNSAEISKKVEWLVKSRKLPACLVGAADTLVAFNEDLENRWTAVNAQYTRSQIQAFRDLFDHVEKTPLTEEQARATVCFDERVQLVAAAGSGKTSVMVAKAIYAVQRGLAEPERIVMLAFNRSAADELARRVQDAAGRLGMGACAVHATTFHALGLSVLNAGGEGARFGVVGRNDALAMLRNVVSQCKQDRGFVDKWQSLVQWHGGREAEWIDLVRTFVRHYKSNVGNPQTLRDRLRNVPAGASYKTCAQFVDVVLPVVDGFNKALREANLLDFEDMLNLASVRIERGEYAPPYSLVLVDEFQDVSFTRARLCEALLTRPGSRLFVVGDDWQSIYRFAGADVSVMTNFEAAFGRGSQLMLTRTFRCPQALCDVSSHFVQRNPRQIRKMVRSSIQAVGPAVRMVEVDAGDGDGRDRIESAVRNFLASMQTDLSTGRVPSGRNGKASVLVLVRYGREKFDVGTYADMTCECKTMHVSKGLEADYVIIPFMITRKYGLSFPSTREDDTLLTLAMPDLDPFPYGEERRLFYVALTRARRGVTMFTIKGQRSPFLSEVVPAA